jgi:hypothetical protein
MIGDFRVRETSRLSPGSLSPGSAHCIMLLASDVKTEMLVNRT